PRTISRESLHSPWKTFKWGQSRSTTALILRPPSPGMNPSPIPRPPNLSSEKFDIAPEARHCEAILRGIPTPFDAIHGVFHARSLALLALAGDLHAYLRATARARNHACGKNNLRRRGRRSRQARRGRQGGIQTQARSATDCHRRT